MNSDPYWRRKLSAYLHDSPDKLIDLADHEGRALGHAQAEGFEPRQEARKDSDVAASAADRLPWPKSKLGDQFLCRSDFNAADSALVHPLGGSNICFKKDFPSALTGQEISGKTLPKISSDDPRASFLTVWRFWRNWASSVDERFACLPAETRLPDHTIWNHLAVTSAMQGCMGGSADDWDRDLHRPKRPLPDRPSFLMFTIGPVQDFIAAARNTRDLWSGSYLLSYLVGTALARIALDFGPDHVLFPNLTNQPIIDLLLKQDVWDKLKTSSGEDLWRAFHYYQSSGKERLLTPSLPNRFLALLPATMSEHPSWKDEDAHGHKGAARYAHELEQAIRDRLKEIGNSVAERCSEKLGDEFNLERFNRQIHRLLEIHWQVLPWDESIESTLLLTSHVPGEDDKHPLDSVRSMLTMLNQMPEGHRDPRYFQDGNVGAKGQAGTLRQVSNTWSALFSFVSWQMDAVKTARSFPAWSQGCQFVGREQNKDSLNGKEEACLTVPKDTDGTKPGTFSKSLAENEHAFKPGDLLGASTLIKRLWHLTWLSKEHPFNPGYPDFDFAMPNTRSIAAHQPFAGNADEEDGDDNEGKYFAVIALDGDEMGKWISGIKCPKLRDQLSKEARDYFDQNGNSAFLDARRPLSPSFHLQFSELLANFGLFCVRNIVNAFDGRLIYAGGDDVLAMLPADTVLECARALRAAFRGEPILSEIARGVVDRSSKNRDNWKSDRKTPLFKVEHQGFIKLTPEATPHADGLETSLLSAPVEFPFIIPGPAADCSVGISIAHFKSPLQDVMRTAQLAEKRAKNELGRGAAAITLMKRSGETIEWGFQWDGGGLEAYTHILRGIQKKIVSGKFPHRIIELVEAYQTDDPHKLGGTKAIEGFAQIVRDVLANDISTAAQRQKGTNYTLAEAGKIRDGILDYLDHTSLSEPDRKVRDLIGLCQTVAFIERNLKDDFGPDSVSAQTQSGERQTMP